MGSREKGAKSDIFEMKTIAKIQQNNCLLITEVIPIRISVKVEIRSTHSKLYKYVVVRCSPRRQTVRIERVNSLPGPSDVENKPK